MNNDLISRSALKAKWCEENCGNCKCIDAMDKCVFAYAIEDAPTAYDVDKVVEELEDKSFPFDDDFGGQQIINIEDVIEIVKKGGISDGRENE